MVRRFVVLDSDDEEEDECGEDVVHDTALLTSRTSASGDLEYVHESGVEVEQVQVLQDIPPVPVSVLISNSTPSTPTPSTQTPPPATQTQTQTRYQTSSSSSSSSSSSLFFALPHYMQQTDAMNAPPIPLPKLQVLSSAERLEQEQSPQDQHANFTMPQQQQQQPQAGATLRDKVEQGKGKEFVSASGSLTSQNVRQRVVTAHEALLVNSSDSTAQPVSPTTSSRYLDGGVTAAGELGGSVRSTSIHSERDNHDDGSIHYIDSDLEMLASKTKPKKNNVSTTTSDNTKSKKSKRAKTVGGLFEENDDDNDGDWTEGKVRKSAKKAAPKKQPVINRSKTSILYATETPGEDGNDDDYSPAGKSRKEKRKPAEVNSTTGRKKKTRSNTDDWELMPALPKGRKSTVLKQLAEGWDFDREGDIVKVAVETIDITSSGRSPSLQTEVPSPFKVDLARDSLILPDEEKEKYDVFSPQIASPNTAESRHGRTSLQSSAVNLPLVSSNSQELLESNATGIMSSTIPDEEYFASKAQAEKGEEIKAIEVSSATRKANTKRKLGSRSKTLADILVHIEDSEDDEGEHEDVNIPKPKKNPPESPTTKRLRMKQTRGKTSITLSPVQSHPHPDSLNSNGDSIPTSPLKVSRKKPITSRIVAASDDESSLSELDEVPITSPGRPGGGVSRLEAIQKKTVYEERDNRQDSPVISTITVTTQVDNQTNPAPKTGKRKMSSRKPSKVLARDSEGIHDGKDFVVVADEQNETVTKKPPAKRRRKSSAVENTDNGDGVDDKPLQHRQASDLMVNVDDHVTSDGELNKKVAVKGKKKTAAPRRRITTTKPKKPRKDEEDPPIESLETTNPASNENEDDDDDDDLDANIRNKSKFSNRNGLDMNVSLEFQDNAKGEGDSDAHSTSTPPPMQSKPGGSRVDNTAQQQQPPEPQTPKKKDSKVKNPHSPINGGKPPNLKFRVGLSRRVNIEPLHAYLRR